MPMKLDQKLIVAISSRALFDLDESNRIYEEQGVDAYEQYQIQHEEEILKPGVAFSLVQKLLQINEHQPSVEVILLSRNSADTGLRIFNSIQHYQLNITRAAFTSGQSPYEYIRAFGSHLFLSSHAEDVRDALRADCAAATIMPRPKDLLLQENTTQLKIAFDGDSVIFSDESEKIFQTQGLEAFSQNEITHAKNPLSGGPFRGFLAALHQIQRAFPAKTCPIRTALVTARQAPAHKRVIETLRSWDIRIDEALFLGGLEKGEFLRAFHADIFFDDQTTHCQSANKHVTTGHVPSGIANEKREHE